MKNFKSLPFLFLSIVLFACGGGGDSNAPTINQKRAVKSVAPLADGSYRLVGLQCSEGDVAATSEMKKSAETSNLSFVKQGTSFVSTKEYKASHCVRTSEDKIVSLTADVMTYTVGDVTCSAECSETECRANKGTGRMTGVGYAFDGKIFRLIPPVSTGCNETNAKLYLDFQRQ